MKTISLVGILLAVVLAGVAIASPERVVLTSSLTYRADGQGTYLFKGSGKLSGTAISSDGTVEYTDSPGTYELILPFKTKDLISGITINYKYTGKVTMEASATGQQLTYVPVTNGVPLQWGDFTSGTELKWRATLGPGSKLSEVKVDYTIITGVSTSWGTPELSGFKFRKPIYIKGAESGALFNYQIPIKIAESSKAGDYDVLLKGALQSGFSDVRFTATDKETLLSYWLESIEGATGSRAATFWVKIPQLPKNGLVIYLYYGKAGAADLSNGYETFDFFDDFKGGALDSAKWKEYKLKDVILEYRAKAASGSKAGVIVRGNAENEDETLSVSSSNIVGDEYCIYIGKAQKVNSNKAIESGIFYNYRVIAEGKNITFQRFKGNFGELDTGVTLADVPLSSGYIGLLVDGEPKGDKTYYEWVRVRQLAAIKPQVDIAKTEGALVEVPNLGSFDGVTVAGNGDLILDAASSEGEYLSPVIYSTLPVRIMVPSWEAVTPDTSSLAADISATGLANEFKKDCTSENYYYASKKDFKEGKSLKWRARLERQNISAASSRLQEFSLDYRPGAITLVNPDGRENIKAGANYEIGWSAWEYEPSYEMKLEYSLDAGDTYNLIVKETDNDGHYLWMVPNKLADKAMVKISDSLNAEVYDVSNATFSITEEGEETEATSENVAAATAEIEKAKAEEAQRLKAAQEAKEAAELAAARLKAEEEAKTATEAETLDIDLERNTVDFNKLLKVGPGKGKELYDVMIKLGSNTTGDTEKDKGAYREGDIVAIVAAGHKWSETELKSSLIVQLYLTQNQVGQLLQPKEISEGADKDGKPINKMVRIRARGIDLAQFGLKPDMKNREVKLEQIKKAIKNKTLLPEEQNE